MTCAAITIVIASTLSLATVAKAQRPEPFVPNDLKLIRTVSDVQLSPNGSQALITVTRSEAPGRPTTEVRLVTLATGDWRRLGRDGTGGSGARWSPTGNHLAYLGREGTRYGLIVARGDGSAARMVADVAGTNHPLPTSGGEACS